MIRLLIMCLTFALVACGSKNNDGTASSSKTTFTGKWTQGYCQDSGGYSNVTILEFTETHMIGWDLNHTGDGCKSELFRRAMDTETLSDVSGSKLTRTSYQAETLNVVMTATGVTTANTLKFCEIADWKASEVRDTRNKSCVWMFGSSAVSMGTAKDPDFVAQTRTNYYQVENDELCFAEKPIIEASTTEKICWKRVSE